MEMLLTQRGKPQLLYGGFRYICDKRVSGGIRWRCPEKFCRGSVLTRGDERIFTDHSHAPDPGKMEKARVAAAIRQMAENGQETTEQIIGKCLNGISEEAASYMPTTQSVQRLIQRRRKSVRYLNGTPKTNGTIEIGISSVFEESVLCKQELSPPGDDSGMADIKSELLDAFQEASTDGKDMTVTCGNRRKKRSSEAEPFATFATKKLKYGPVTVNMPITKNKCKPTDIKHCSLCRELLVNPRNLPCLHAFCFQCIQNEYEHRKGDVFSCPLCAENFSLNDGDLKTLPENIFLSRLVDAKSTSVGESLCNDCATNPDKTEVPPAVVYCAECEQKLCKDCEKLHRRQVKLRLHVLVPLEKQHIEGSTATGNCNLHPEKMRDFYCNDCQVVLCVLCRVANHKVHSVTDSISAGEEARKRLEASVLTMLSDTERQSKERLSQLNTQIELHRKCITTLQEEISEMEIQNVELERHMSSVEYLQMYCREIKEQGTVEEVLKEGSLWQEKADKLKEHHLQLFQVKFSSLKDTVQKTTDSFNQGNELH